MCYLNLYLNQTIIIVLTAGLYSLAFIETTRNQLVEAHGHVTGCLRIRQQIYSKKRRKIVEGKRVDRHHEIVCVFNMFVCVCYSANFAARNRQEETMLWFHPWVTINKKTIEK